MANSKIKRLRRKQRRQHKLHKLRDELIASNSQLERDQLIKKILRISPKAPIADYLSMRK